jgi:hypothetical protein
MILRRLPFAAVFLLLIPAARGQAVHRVCASCHAENAAGFLTHPHAKAGLSCDICHGGSQAHAQSGGNAEVDRVVAAPGMAELCGTCHAAATKGGGAVPKGQQIVEVYLASRHGQLVAERSRTRAPNCGACHGVHELRGLPAMEARCKGCHDSLPAACAAAPPDQVKSGLICARCHQPHLFSRGG